MADSTYKNATKILLWIAGTIIFLYLVYLLTEILVILALSILLAFIFVFIQNNNFKSFLILILNAVCIYSLATDRYHEKFGFIVFGARNQRFGP